MSDAIFNYGLFCEYAKLEANGQLTIIGSWGSQLVIFADPPAQLQNISFVANVIDNESKGISGKIKFIFPGMPDLPEMPFAIEPQDGIKEHNFIFNISNPILTNPGIIAAEINADRLGKIRKEMAVVFGKPKPTA